MSFTDEQFRDFMKEFSLTREVREAMIRIETIVKLNHESYEEQKSRVAADIQEARNTAKKAHERIDAEVKARLLFAGGFGALGLILSFVTIVLKLTGKL